MEHFGKIPDTRTERMKLYKLFDILFITITAAIGGAYKWEDTEEFAEIRYDWLETASELPNGIPVYDTFTQSFFAFRPKGIPAMFYSMGAIHCADNKKVKSYIEMANGFATAAREVVSH